MSLHKCVINGCFVPTKEEVAAGKLPFVLLRWPKGLEKPVPLQQEMDSKLVIGTPSCNLNVPWSGGAVQKFREVSNAMHNGQRFMITVDFDPTAVRLTGTKAKNDQDKDRFYLQLDPTAVYLNKIEEVEPVWTGVSGTTEDEEYARFLNKAVSATTAARFAARRTTMSGTPEVAEESGGTTVDDSDI